MQLLCVVGTCCIQKISTLLVLSDLVEIQIVSSSMQNCYTCNLDFWLFSVPPETLFYIKQVTFLPRHSLRVRGPSPVRDGFSVPPSAVLNPEQQGPPHPCWIVFHPKLLHSVTGTTNDTFCMQKYGQLRRNINMQQLLSPIYTINCRKKSNYCQDFLIIDTLFSMGKNNIFFSVTYQKFVTDFITIFCKTIAGNTGVCKMNARL